MMQRLLLFMLFSAVLIAGAADLTDEIARLKKEIGKLKEGCKCERSAFSFQSAVKKAAGLTADVANHVLAQTELDDRLLHQVVTHKEIAKAITADVVTRVSSLDYESAIQELTSHPMYCNASKPARFYVDQYVNPLLDRANVYLDPVLNPAKEFVGTAKKTIWEDVMPDLRRVGNKAFEHVSDVSNYIDKTHSVLQAVVSPIFDSLHRIAPVNAKDLPRHPVDRLLLIIVVCFVAYSVRCFIMNFVTLSITLMKIIITFSWRLLFTLVSLPIRVFIWLLIYFLWLFTLFGCCAPCRRRRREHEKEKTTDESLNSEAHRNKNNPGPASSNCVYFDISSTDRQISGASTCENGVMFVVTTVGGHMATVEAHSSLSVRELKEQVAAALGEHAFELNLIKGETVLKPYHAILMEVVALEGARSGKEVALTVKENVCAGKDVTVKELSNLLEKAWKQKKLQAVSRFIVDVVKANKTMEGPPRLKDKKVPMEVAKTVLSKYKDLDLQKLGL